MSRAPSQLESHLGYWLRMVSNAVSREFARKVEGQGVTVAEWVLLRALQDLEKAPPSLLADRMGMTRGAITKLANRLVAKSLMTRVQNPQDGRAQTLALTPEGRALVPRLARIADQNDAGFFNALPRADREQLERILRSLARLNAVTDVPVD